MSQDSPQESSSSSSARRNGPRRGTTPRLVVTWASVLAGVGLVAFAWHAQGQDAANTRQFLERLKSGGQSLSTGPTRLPYDAIGGGVQSQSPPANRADVAMTPDGQLLPSQQNTQQPVRVAERTPGPALQGPSFGQPAPNGPRPDRSAFPPSANSQPAQQPSGSQVVISPPPLPHADQDDAYEAPAPVGGFGEAGRAGDQFPPASNNRGVPNPPTWENSNQPPMGNNGGAPFNSAPAEGIQSPLNGPMIQPIPADPDYIGPRYQTHAQPHAGLGPRQFASAGTGRGVPYGQGAYVQPGRVQHVHEYRLRVDDVLDCVYRITRNESSKPYELNVGDKIRVESLTEPKLTRELIIQPDGTVSVLLLGQVRATRQTVEQFRRRLEELYREYYHNPDITITPLSVNTKLLDVINTVDSRAGEGGQVRQARVAPDGTISLPAVGKIPVQGMTLDEVKREIDARYAAEVDGIEVTPILIERAKRFVYVLGEVKLPGRYELLGPTNVMQAISLANGWNVGANLQQVVVFRRGADWRIQATMLNIWDTLYGNSTCPVEDIWLSDSDVIIVPKMKILVTDEFIDLIFTRGIYGVFPLQGASLNFSKLSTL